MFEEVYPPNPFLDVNRNRAFYCTDQMREFRVHQQD